jgi:DNA primase
MALFPQSFLDDVRTQADIVQVVQDTVALRKVGATYKGLCPFHAEKTPSFHVNRERGFFHCFGCGVGGDVFKFVELRDRLGFGEAVRLLADRFGVPIPRTQGSAADDAADTEREALLKIHELAAAWFREQLAGKEGAPARTALQKRGMQGQTIDMLGLGLALPGREELKSYLQRQGLSLPLLVRSGLLIQRDNGEIVDRFRNRLMIPICRESGSVIAFGGRALLQDQVPKYLNSPETPIYSKSRTLYGLHISRSAIRQAAEAVLVEGYFDLAQAWQAGVRQVIATCGTALTVQQAHTLRRYAARVVLSYDADQAGQGATARSSELLVGEGFAVSVAVLPAGEDPDTFVRRHGGEAYCRAVSGSRPYLDFLLDRAASAHDFANPDSRREFVHQMLVVAARIPDATARDQFADRIAHQARISEDVVRSEIRRAAVAKKTVLPARLPGTSMKPVERHLLASLIQTPAETVRTLAELEESDFEGLAARNILLTARALAGESPEALPGLLMARLNERETQAVTAVATGMSGGIEPPGECARTLRRLRYERERADVQRELDRIQDSPAGSGLDALLQRKSELSSRIEALKI